MTLSNFDWTDKTSVRWFILLPTGHEGPYSLSQLLSLAKSKSLNPATKVWAEGLPAPLTLREVKSKESAPVIASPTEPEELPPLPEEDIPPIPVEEETVISKKQSKLGAYLFLVIILLGLGGFGLYSWLKAQENFQIRRYSKMSLDLFDRINREHRFQDWGKSLFFKEYVSQDLSHIWLVTSSFHSCDVSVTFNSLPDKMLSMNDEKISFQSNGRLDEHVVELTKFDFTAGSRIMPGMYEMKVLAENCHWGGLPARLANKFQAPEKKYSGVMKVILFPGGAQEFNTVLERLLRKKNELEVKNANQEELFWQGLEEKFQTLLAITLQIEQHFYDLIAKDARMFHRNLKPSIDDYTKRYGHFLTNFVVSNEAYFKELSESDLKELSQKRNYETMVRLMAKRIGFESMKYIEEMQALKKPKRVQLNELKERMKNSYEALKSNISETIEKISEDQAS